MDALAPSNLCFIPDLPWICFGNYLVFKQFSFDFVFSMNGILFALHCATMLVREER